MSWTKRHRKGRKRNKLRFPGSRTIDDKYVKKGIDERVFGLIENEPRFSEMIKVPQGQINRDC